MAKKVAMYLGVGVVLFLAVVGAISLLPERTSTAAPAGTITEASADGSETRLSSSTETSQAVSDVEAAPLSVSPSTTVAADAEVTTSSVAPGPTATLAVPADGSTRLATLIMSRTILGIPNAGPCARFDEDPTIHPGSIPLLDTAAYLTSVGVSATHTVVPGWTDPTEPTCRNSASLVGSWETAATLRDDHGWSAVSHGTNKVNLTELTEPEELREETCGSIPLLEAQGHPDASSFFNFPGNFRTPEIEALVASCFEFGRRYSSPEANTFDAVRSGSLIKTQSVSGGTCLGCVSTHKQDYRHPVEVVNGVIGAPAAETWGLVLFYKLVVGSEDTGHQQWDCTSPDPADHWTNQGEVYCWDDFVWVIDQLNAAGVTWVSPAEVAAGAIPNQP